LYGFFWLETEAKMRTILGLALLVISVSFSSDVIAVVQRGRPNCPLLSVDHLWKDYLSGRYGDTDPAFSIRFDKNMGPIAPGCYHVFYRGNKNWFAAGYNASQKESFVDTRTGDIPDSYTMNIWGATFSYNEKGEVFDSQGNVVGHLTCNMGSDC
jgi:hypothetical protein